MHKVNVIVALFAMLYVTDACHPMWYNECHDHTECCSGYCYKGEGDMWFDGVCKLKPKDTSPNPQTGSCQPLWYNTCKENAECCSGYCYKGEGDMWLDGVCKPQTNQQRIAPTAPPAAATTTTTEISYYDLIDPRIGSGQND